MKKLNCSLLEPIQKNLVTARPPLYGEPELPVVRMQQMYEISLICKCSVSRICLYQKKRNKNKAAVHIAVIISVDPRYNDQAVTVLCSVGLLQLLVPVNCLRRCRQAPAVSCRCLLRQMLRIESNSGTAKLKSDGSVMEFAGYKKFIVFIIRWSFCALDELLRYSVVTIIWAAV